MKKTKTLIGTACLVGTYFTTWYSAVVDLEELRIWGTCATVILLFIGLILIIEDNAL